MKPEQPSANRHQVFRQAVEYHQRGDLVRAERLYLQILAAAPLNAAPRHLLGVLRAQQGRNAEALELIEGALKINPRDAEALSNYGNILKTLRRFDDALASYDKALAIEPDLAEALNNRGNVLWEVKRFEDALRDYDKAFAANPRFIDALNNRGNALRELGRLEEAVASYEKALAFRPDFADALNNRGSALWKMNRLEDALASFDCALAIKPDFADALSNRGSVLWLMKRTDEALASFDRALAIRPDFAMALSNRGKMLWGEKRDYESAILDMERLIRIDPDYVFARGDLLHFRMHGGDWRDFDREVAAIDEGVRQGKLLAQPFIYQGISSSPADLMRCSMIYAASHYPAAQAVWKNAGRDHDKIRLGYLCGEFREHATALLSAGLFECHDKSKFELFAFDSGRNDNSATRKRLETAFDGFVDIAKLTDGQAVEEVRAREIDILVNLNGYFGSPRMGIFASRPAPIQVNYLGFPATLGAPYIDYILADSIVIPEDERRYYTEQVVYLPDTYQANDSKRPIAPVAPVRSAHGLPETAFAFCNFNQSYKLTPGMFAVWMRILREVEGSVLWLLKTNEKFPENLRREAERQDVSGERLVFTPFNPDPADHLARLKLADLFLDSLPSNAHTTASDALWAGLPLLTCRGSAFPGRVAASLLYAIGLADLVTDNLDAYTKLAVRLAREPLLLQSVREKLAQNRLRTPLFDTDRFRRHIESAYRTMWEIHRCGEPPRGFSVPSG